MNEYMNRRFFICALHLFVVVIVFVGCSHSKPSPMSDLRDELNRLVADYDATVGIGIITAQGDTMTVNNNIRYPMMSVFKFHQAVAVANYMSDRGISLDTTVLVLPDELKLDTWSPLRDKYPQGNVALTVSQLFAYTLQLSDNLACDILFDRFLAPKQVQDFVRGSGIDDISILYNEAEMFADNDLGYENWTTPYAAAMFLDKFIDGKLISQPCFSFVKDLMIGCTTGTNRLVKPFQNTDYKVGHKTGSGYVNDEGRIASTNDIGFVLSPEGEKAYVIAVFVKDSALPQAETEEIIAKVSAIVKKHLLV